MNRSIAPEYTQAKDLKIIAPEKRVSANGVEVYLMRDVKDSSVKIDLEWSAGTKYQPKKLVSNFTNKLIFAGTAEKTSNRIAEEIDFYGGYTSLEVDKDHAALTIYGLNDKISDICSLVKDAFQNAAFPEIELQKELSIAKSKFNIDIEKVKVLCSRTFNRELYGENSAYGQIAELEDFDKLTREDLISFYNEFYKTKPVIFITGNVTDIFVEEVLEWANYFEKETKSIDSDNNYQAKGLVKIEKADAIQSAIRVGRLMFDKNHKDYFNFQLLNTILGGYFGSRLMANIREDKGYTYGIGSGMAVLQDASYFFISTEVGKDVNENTIIEIKKELKSLCDVQVSEDELLKVKNYMLGEFLRQADGPLSQMEIFKNIYFNNLKSSFYHDFIQAIHSVTASDLKELAKKYFVEEEMLIVVAG